MMQRLILRVSLATCFMLVIFQANGQASTVSNDSTVYVKIRVDGLACPFCAYGLEKKLRKIPGQQDLHIDIEQGEVTFHVSAGREISEKELSQIVKEAGFTAREVTFSNHPFNNSLQNDP